MATANNRLSNLVTEADAFKDAIREFGVVTVMNAKVYDLQDFKDKSAEEVQTALVADTPIATIDSLKVANVTVDGPSKTVTGGRYSNPLIKFGKSARLEMQDALGRAEVLEAFGGVINEFSDSAALATGQITGVHITEDFASPKTIMGETFLINRKTGHQVPVDIIFYQFLPDSIFNLTQDAEGDATVFDMNGDLLTTEIMIGTDGTPSNAVPHGVFYSILPHKNKE